MNNNTISILLITIVINACSQENKQQHDDNIDLQSVSSTNVDLNDMDTTSIETLGIDSVRLNYTWISNFDVANTLVNRIPVPDGFKRVASHPESYGYWLRHIPLKEGRPNVLLYNKEEKWNQSAHVAVLDLDVDERNLQQCADAVMRLKAEFHYQKEDFSNIHFKYTSGDNIPFSKWITGKRPSVSGHEVIWKNCTSCDETYPSFRKYMLSIFNYAGTASLEKELSPKAWTDIQIGDVVINGGSPGHAVIVLDVAIDTETDEKLFLLAQSYMPAQESHILRNPVNSELSPWYSVSEIASGPLDTPEWSFTNTSLRSFNF